MNDIYNSGYIAYDLLKSNIVALSKKADAIDYDAHYKISLMSHVDIYVNYLENNKEKRKSEIGG